jgi:hypothetical protein
MEVSTNLYPNLKTQSNESFQVTHPEHSWSPLTGRAFRRMSMCVCGVSRRGGGEESIGYVGLGCCRT